MGSFYSKKLNTRRYEETPFSPHDISPLSNRLLLSSSATSRLLLHSKIYDEVIKKVLDRASSVSVGSPLRPEDKEAGTYMGPLVSGPQRDKVLGFVSRVRTHMRQSCRTQCGQNVMGGGEEGCTHRLTS